MNGQASIVAGARVETGFGPGVVSRPTSTGALVLLDKLPCTPVHVMLGDIRVVHEPTPSDDVVETRPPRHSSVDSDVAVARKSVEALRFGIVPTFSVSEVTVGYSDLECWLRPLLPRDREVSSHVSEVCGGFGSGKSHTMASLRHIAQEAGYATASVEVNGNDISLSDPEGVLRQIWPTTSGTDLESATPLLDMHLEALANGVLAAGSALEEYPRVLANLKAISSLKRFNALDLHAEDVEDFIGCGDSFTASYLAKQFADSVFANGGNRWSDQITVKRLVAHSTEERAGDFVRCLRGYATVARRAGFRGLVITIDEFEVEYNLTAAKLDRVRSLVHALCEGLAGANCPLALFVATVGQDGHDGDSIVEALVEATEGETYVLPKWTRSAMRELAGKIHRLYGTAYSNVDAFDADDVKAVEDVLDDDDVRSSGIVRAFIKAYVSALDVKHGPVSA